MILRVLVPKLIFFIMVLQSIEHKTDAKKLITTSQLRENLSPCLSLYEMIFAKRNSFGKNK